MVKKSIKYKILYLIFSMLIFVGVMLMFKDYRDVKGLILKENNATIETFYKVFESELKNRMASLSMSMELLLQNNDIKTSFVNKDREKLSKLTAGYYKNRLKPDFGIKQFQFHVPPAISFFRVHKLSKFGDDLSGFRKTVIAANRDKKPVIGLEVGRAGLGLRIVYNVSHDGKHIGSVEFGSSINNILRAASEATGIEYSVGIYSDVFKAAKRFENKSTDVIKGNLVYFDFSKPSVQGIVKGFKPNGKDRITKLKGSSFASKEFDLKDYSGNSIGKLLVLKDVTEQLKASINNLILKGLVYFVALLGVSGIIVFVLVKLIVRPIEKAVYYTNRIGEGDLSVHIECKSNDEVGVLLCSLNTMVDKFTTMINDVKCASQNVASSSHQLNSFSMSMSDGMVEQADRSAQIATATVQMFQTIAEVTKSITDISSYASNTLDVAKTGENIVKQTVSGVKNIETSVSELSSVIESLGSSSKQIGDLVGSINEIADQTNLLALNAAIESARAGEQGRGFAVVADEVRKLAEKTAKATTEIRVMINEIRQETDGAMKSMEQSLEQVVEGVNLTNEAGAALNQIVDGVVNLQEKAQHIASSTEEMSAVSGQIEGDIEVVASVSNENKQSAGQLSDSSANLERLSAQLNELVSQFKMIEQCRLK